MKSNFRPLDKIVISVKGQSHSEPLGFAALKIQDHILTIILNRI